MCSGGTSPETGISSTRSSPVITLPLEVVQTVIACLVGDTRSLLACSRTCYSWYIAAVPHLHDTLTTSAWYLWPKSLWNARRLGLLPLVKTFQIQSRDTWHLRGFSPKQLGYCNLRHFRALTNVQELGIDHLDIPSFIPNVQLYFGHFLPTLRSLAMGEPKGSRRQIIYFIGLFRHLEDLKILYDAADRQEEAEDDMTLIPSFAPPLRGQLTMCSTGVGLLKDMIDLFGGIRFRYLDIFNVGGTPILLGACAETLETLRLYPTDPRGKGHSLGNVWVLADDSAASHLWEFNLFENKLLRTLEISMRHLDGALQTSSPPGAVGLFMYVLLTVESPLFSKLVVFYRDFDFCGVEPPWARSLLHRVSGGEAEREAQRHAARFAAFRLLQAFRHFQLVFCVDVWEGVGDYAARSLEEAVAAEKARGGFNWFSPEPLVLYRPRRARQSSAEYRMDPLIPWLPL